MVPGKKILNFFGAISLEVSEKWPISNYFSVNKKSMT